MRLRLVFCVTLLVMAAHWAVMFSPLELISATAAITPSTPEHLQTVWIAPPPAAVPPKPPPAPAPRIARQAKRSVTPRPVPPPAATPDVVTIAAAAPEEAPAMAPSQLQPPDATAPDTAEASPAPAAGPSLHVRDAANAPVTIDVPSDGSALAQQMALRFKVEGFVKGMQYHAHAELAWQADGQTYHARQSISAFLLGSLEQTSTGLLTPQGLQPLQFVDRRLRKKRTVQLDWPARQALFGSDRQPAPIGPGTQDRLSVFLQLASMLQAMPGLRTPGTRIDIPTLGSRRMQMWSFAVEGEALLDLPSGPVTTLRLHRLPQAGDDETTQLWLHPALGYVPARIRMQEHNGDVMELTLKP